MPTAGRRQPPPPRLLLPPSCCLGRLAAFPPAYPGARPPALTHPARPLSFPGVPFSHPPTLPPGWCRVPTPPLLGLPCLHHFPLLQLRFPVRGNSARFINHSCEPNCSIEKWQVGDQHRVVVVARRALQPGEEVTVDYRWGEAPDGALRRLCLCRAELCRGFMHKEGGGEEDEGGHGTEAESKAMLRDAPASGPAAAASAHPAWGEHLGAARRDAKRGSTTVTIPASANTTTLDKSTGRLTVRSSKGRVVYSRTVLHPDLRGREGSKAKPTITEAGVAKAIGATFSQGRCMVGHCAIARRVAARSVAGRCVAAHYVTLS